MYSHEIVPPLQKILNKLSKKDKSTYEQVLKKIEEIINSPDIEHYKNLRYDLKDKKRVHIGHFVLVFKFIKEENKIKFLDFDHHDKIYRKLRI
jgi:YafQ family addiction module toxin component